MGKWRVKVIFNGQMEKAILEIIKKIKSMGMGSLGGLMVGSIEESGFVGNSME